MQGAARVARRSIVAALLAGAALHASAVVEEGT